MIIKDDIAQIFKNSTRAKRTFPEFEPGVSAAICLARYVQEPLAEYCALWKNANAVELFGFEALYLDVHPLKVIESSNEYIRRYNYFLIFHLLSFENIIPKVIIIHNT